MLLAHDFHALKTLLLHSPLSLVTKLEISTITHQAFRASQGIVVTSGNALKNMFASALPSNFWSK